jgi:hypothetical protein
MQCKDFEAVLEQEGLAPLPSAAKSHLAECPACQTLLADLSAIVSSAKELPAETNPPERLWVSLRARMEAEGLIKPQPVSAVADQTSWWQGLTTLFRPRVLLTAGVSLGLALAAFLTVHKKPVGVSGTTAPSATVVQVPAPVQPTKAEPVLSTPPAPAPQQLAAAKPPSKPVPAATSTFKPSPSDSLYTSTSAALRDAESDLGGPSLRGSVEADASQRENLRVINEVIAECQKHLKKYPQDTLAREYLASAYQQKAELLAAILDSGRSEQ